MLNTNNDEISKSLEMFLSDEYDKVFTFLGTNRDGHAPNNYDKNHDESEKSSKQNLAGNYKPLKFSRHTKKFDQIEVEEDSLDDESPSESRFTPSIAKSEQESQEYLSFDSESIFPIKEVNKADKERPKSKTKTSKKERIIPTDENINNEKKFEGNRKIRTTVSEEKIKILEHLFPYIEDKIAYKGTIINLKDVAKIVNLGYSTILHKYKDYRRKGVVEKGLLLKSKDIKRKYQKSLVIETYIKQALSDRKFNTAKELAEYISETYKLKVNRSIISRHLNEMQREKNCEYVGDILESEFKEDEVEMIEHYTCLREFSRIFLGLKNEKFDFFYITVIRMYFINGRVTNQLPTEDAPIDIVNLVITATESQLALYYPMTQSESINNLVKNESHNLKFSAIGALYDELLTKIDEVNLDVEENREKVYVVFPYENKHKEFLYRQKVMKRMLDERINVIVIPPQLNTKKSNFILSWFFRNVMPKIQNETFSDLNAYKESLMKVMNQEQKSLCNYAFEMISVIKKSL